MSLSLTPVTIVANKAVNESQAQIFLSQRLLDTIGLAPNQEVRIFLGKSVRTFTILLREIPFPEIHISEKMSAAFLIPLQTIPLQAMFDCETNSFFLGPVIGLLTDLPLSPEEKPDFRSIHSFCEELGQRISEIGGLFYVFTYKDFAATAVSGYYFADGKWTFAALPLPDVIYNRIHSRKLEQLRIFQTFREKLDRYNIPFFNDRFLSKWEVYQALSREEKMKPFLPETELLSKENLTAFIKKFPTLFLKPVHGSQGKNIIKLSQDDAGLLHVQTSFSSPADQLGKRLSQDEIFQKIDTLLARRMYIIQQGIPLVAHQSRAMDFRVLCHKSENDHWISTSVVARISSEQQFVSNVAQGGEVVKPLSALGLFFQKKTAKEILALLKEIAIEAAAIISRYSAGITGELGIDIGVDTAGKLWLIEINSKPSKNFEHNKQKIRPSTKAIVQFCTLLAFETMEQKEG